MYETEELWRAKGGPRQSATRGLAWWILRSGLLAGCAIAILVWVFGDFATSIDGRDARLAVGEPSVDRGGEGAEAQSAASAIFERELEIRRSANGHFLLTAHVNGVALPFLVDTGASDIALSPQAAEALGLNLKSLDYSRSYQTANGEILAAPLLLRDIRVKELRLYDVEASVLQAPMELSLLGMSFLGQLSSYEVRGDRLLLRW